MKKSIIAVLSTIIVLLSGGVAVEKLGFSEFNDLQNPVITSTSTGSFATNVPVKVLDNKTGRRYARIINDDDTSDVYLYITNDALCHNFAELASGCDASATSTITELTGIRLENEGGYYDITPDNQFTGEVWATSSASSVKIITIER